MVLLTALWIIIELIVLCCSQFTRVNGVTTNYALASVVNALVVNSNGGGGGGGGGGGFIQQITTNLTNATLQLKAATLPALSVPGNAQFTAFVLMFYSYAITYGPYAIPIWILLAAILGTEAFIQYRKGNSGRKQFTIYATLAGALVIFYFISVGLVAP